MCEGLPNCCNLYLTALSVCYYLTLDPSTREEKQHNALVYSVNNEGQHTNKINQTPTNTVGGVKCSGPQNPLARRERE